MKHGGERGLVASLVFKTSGLSRDGRRVRFPSTSANFRETLLRNADC